ncbi:MAG: RNA polymerase sigma factor RpoE, partial [uncultured Rubrobacteraceae bacterium]
GRAKGHRSPQEGRPRRAGGPRKSPSGQGRAGGVPDLPRPLPRRGRGARRFREIVREDRGLRPGTLLRPLVHQDGRKRRHKSRLPPRAHDPLRGRLTRHPPRRPRHGPSRASGGGGGAPPRVEGAREASARPAGRHSATLLPRHERGRDGRGREVPVRHDQVAPARRAPEALEAPAPAVARGAGTGPPQRRYGRRRRPWL